MLLIPVVLVIGGILALVLYLEKRSPPIDSKAYSDRGQRMPRCMKKPLPLR